jgi:hypothetical protein
MGKAKISHPYLKEGLMASQFINIQAIEQFPLQAFRKKWPFPWQEFDQFLTPEGFNILHQEFPPLSLFEYHEGIYRGGQRPHNRYYLAYESSIYHKESTPKAGVIHKEDLSPSWQQFIDELEEGPVYKTFIEQSLGATAFNIRYAWHVGTASNEVSPHVDTPTKLGTHIFYFNSRKDWDPAWGGQLLVLGGKLVPGQTPDFQDFTTSTAIQNVDNHSFLFKNTPSAWHGVKPLTCPTDKYRKLFNVIFEL